MTAFGAWCPSRSPASATPLAGRSTRARERPARCVAPRAGSTECWCHSATAPRLKTTSSRSSTRGTKPTPGSPAALGWLVVGRRRPPARFLVTGDEITDELIEHVVDAILVPYVASA